MLTICPFVINHTKTVKLNSSIEGNFCTYKIFETALNIRTWYGLERNIIPQQMLQALQHQHLLIVQ